MRNIVILLYTLILILPFDSRAKKEIFGKLPGADISRIFKAGEYLFAVIGAPYFEDYLYQGEMLYRAPLNTMQWEHLYGTVDIGAPSDAKYVGYAGEVSGRIFMNLGKSNSSYSDDYGDTWTKMDTLVFRSNIIQNGNILYAYISWGFARSLDNGLTWEKLKAPSRIIHNLMFAGDTLFASTNLEPYYSLDSGKSWDTLLVGWPKHTVGVPNYAASIKFFNYNGQIICASDDGPQALNRETLSWSKFGLGGEYVEEVTLIKDTLLGFSLSGLMYYDADSGSWLAHPVFGSRSGSFLKADSRPNIIQNQGTWYFGQSARDNSGGIVTYNPQTEVFQWENSGLNFYPGPSHLFVGDLAVTNYKNSLYVREAAEGFKSFPLPDKNMAIINRFTYSNSLWLNYYDSLLYRYDFSKYPEITASKMQAPFMQTRAYGDTLLSHPVNDNYRGTIGDTLVFAFSLDAGETFDSVIIPLDSGQFDEIISDLFFTQDTLWLLSSTADLLIYKISTATHLFVNTGILIPKDTFGSRIPIRGIRNADNLFVFFNNQALCSTDLGQNWSIATRGIDPTNQINFPIMVSGQTMYFLTNTDLYYTDWSDKEWKKYSVSGLLDSPRTTAPVTFSPGYFSYTTAQDGLIRVTWPNEINPLSIAPISSRSQLNMPKYFFEGSHLLMRHQNRFYTPSGKWVR